MCGIAGFFHFCKTKIFSGDDLERMGDAIRYRGPDDKGSWISESGRVGLHHRRLSIIDLSDSGAQPMVSEDDQHVLIFNGEIYNHLELRRDLEQQKTVNWRGTSDTETLTMLIQKFGLREALSKVDGMFALAHYDKQTGCLSLARDRFGEKPLCYFQDEEVVLFASDLKALNAIGYFPAVINRDAICLFLRHNYIPAPYTIFKNTKKVLPGQIVKIRNGEVIFDKFWDTTWLFEEKTKQFEKQEFRGILKRVLRGQMMSDVPLGAFLSGGVDSTLVAALMQEMSDRPIKTFSIGFHDQTFNEAIYAKQVAEYLGTDHTDYYVSEREALELAKELSSIYDEPFADSSQIPTLLLCRLAKLHVTVALTGDAGDEIFAGYTRYIFASKLWHQLQRVPFVFRRLFSLIAMQFPSSLFTWFFSIVPMKYRILNFGSKLQKLSRAVLFKSFDELYLSLVSHFADPSKLVIGGSEPQTILSKSDFGKKLRTTEHMMALDLLTYLPDDILVKVDRAAMSCSLETRVPFLDHRLVSYAWSLPINEKIVGSATKLPLRSVLYDLVPKKLIDRPKAGFAVPLAKWLRGPLREWADRLLDPSKIADEGFFDQKVVTKIWENHKLGIENNEHRLWNILMFQAWYSHHMEASSKKGLDDID